VAKLTKKEALEQLFAVCPGLRLQVLLRPRLSILGEPSSPTSVVKLVTTASNALPPMLSLNSSMFLV
jgi:hypothetical protein